MRQATTEDSQRLSSVVLEASLSLKHPDFPDEGRVLLESTNTPPAFKERFKSDDYFAYAYQVDAEMAGYMAMINSEKIDHMFVLWDYRKQGICKKLWAAEKKACSENGKNSFFWVRSCSDAEPVYETSGFRHRGERTTVTGISFQYMELNSGKSNQRGIACYLPARWRQPPT